MANQKFDVGGMTCAACKAHVERAVENVPGVSSVSVNLLSGSMAVDYDDASCNAGAICSAVDHAGYSASPVTGTDTAGTGTAAPTGAARMEYEAFASNWTEYPALTAFDFSGGSSSSARAVFTVSGTRLTDGVPQRFTGRSVHLMKTGGLWCISMSQLTAIVEGTP